MKIKIPQKVVREWNKKGWLSECVTRPTEGRERKYRIFK